MSKPRVYFVNLGCPKNLVDSEMLMGELAVNEVAIVTNAADATAIVVNTCGFIEDAKRESIETIVEALQLKEKEDKQVFVTGCLSQRYREELQQEFPEVDGFFGARDIPKIAVDLAGKLGLSGEKAPSGVRVVTTTPAYAYVKIAEGCDNACSFCAIPLIRGKHKSRPKEEIVREVRHLGEHGVREIVLISQDTTYYGRDLHDGSSLVGLLQELDKTEDLDWIRLLYTYPDRITDDLIQILAESDRVCPYIDVPIQHISNRVLKQMRRGSRGEKIRALIQKLRARIPDVAIRTSVMVGFPGETEEDFRELLDFVAETQFEHLGVFKFSREEDTTAYDLPGQIPEEVKQERYELIQDVQQDIVLQVNQKLVGRTLEVLIDDFDEEQGVYLGRTRFDAPEIDNRVLLKGDLILGEMVHAKIVSATEDELVAEAIH